MDDPRYVNFATFRRDGTQVNTPVWVVKGEGNLYYLYSAAGAGKVKRLRNADRARVAVCDLRGKVLDEWHDAVAHIETDLPIIAETYRLLTLKYGFQFALINLLARLSGRIHRRTVISFKLTEKDP